MTKKSDYYRVESLEEAVQILKTHLPFCDQNHPPLIHGGHAIVINWEDLEESNIQISSPDDVDKALS